MDKFIPRNKKVMAAILIGLSLGLFFLQTAMKPDAEIEKTSYLKFEELMNKGLVEKVDINLNSQYFHFTTDSEKQFKTDNPRNDAFKETLLNHGIEVNEVKADNTKQIFVSLLFTVAQYALLLGGLFYILSKQSGIIIGKKPKSIEERPDVKFDDVAGINETKEEIRFLVDFLKSPQKYKDIGAELPKGVILYGPPGTGKTLTAQAIAGEAGVPFYNMSGSDFIEMYVGLGAKRVRNLFQEAREHAPCIVFIDEIDAVGGSRELKNGKTSEDNQTINALLAEMDGFDKGKPVIIVAATNRLEDLDSALIRPGRFDRHIAIGLPDQSGRTDILKIHAKSKKLGDDVDFDVISKLTIGFSGAALKTLINEAAIIAVNKGFEHIRMEDIDDAYYKAVMKGHKKTIKSDEEKSNLELVAYHEAGHALMSKLVVGNSVPKVSIVPSTSGAGGVTFSVPEKMGMKTKVELLNEIKMLYAGRASEEILRGDKNLVTNGASSDIERATELIRRYYNDYGMSDEYGMINITQLDSGVSFMDNAVRLSSQLYEETISFIKEHEEILKSIAKELLKKESISEDELEAAIERGKEMM